MATPPAPPSWKAQAQKKIGGMLDQLDAHLASHGGPWFMGADYTALDAHAFTPVPLDAQLQRRPGA